MASAWLARIVGGVSMLLVARSMIRGARCEVPCYSVFLERGYIAAHQLARAVLAHVVATQNIVACCSIYINPAQSLHRARMSVHVCLPHCSFTASLLHVKQCMISYGAASIADVRHLHLYTR